MHKSRLNSPVWQVTSDKLSEIVRSSRTMRDVLNALGYSPTSFGCNRTLLKRLKHEGIDFKHLPSGRQAWQYVEDITTVMTVDSAFRSDHLKTRLLANGMLRNECYCCGQLPFWNNKTLILQMDHIDGNNRNQTLQNLRMLCPNCHSQTDTFAGRNKKRTVCVL